MPDFLSSLKANQVSNAGSVAPMTFVTIDGVQGNFLCRQATATTDIPLGVSQVGANIAPNMFNTLSAGNYNPANVAGYPGDQIGIFTVGDVASIRISGSATGTGSSAVLPGNALTNDSSGVSTNFGTAVSIAAFTANRYIGGFAVQAGNPGDIIEMFILPGRC
jgi:hypothetical protein